MHLPVDGLPDDDLRHPAREPGVVVEVTQRAFQPGRRDLQRVGGIERVLDVEDRAHVLADPLAVLDPDTVLRTLDDGASCLVAPCRPVDEDAQHQPDRLPPQLHVENLDAARCARPGRRSPGCAPAWRPSSRRVPIKHKKWAASPLDHLSRNERPSSLPFLSAQAVASATGRRRPALRRGPPGRSRARRRFRPRSKSPGRRTSGSPSVR